MARERLSPQMIPEMPDEQDPDFFPLENGGAFADLVQISTSRGKPYMVNVPVVLHNVVWHVRGSITRAGIFPYKPIPDNEFFPLAGTESYTPEDVERLREKFPHLTASNSAMHEVPELETCLPAVIAAVQRKLEQHKK